MLKFILFFFRRKNFDIPEKLKNNENFKVKVLPEGGVETYIKGHKHPYPGFPTEERTSVLHSLKAVLPMAIKVVYKGMLKSKKNVIIKDPKHYSKAVREIYRLFDVLAKRENLPAMKRRWVVMRDVLCSVLELDDAYRFRMQDVLSELNKDKIKLTEADKYFFRVKPYKFNGKIDK